MKFREQKLVLFYLFSDLSLLNLAIMVMALLNPLKPMGDYHVMTIIFLYANLLWLITSACCRRRICTYVMVIITELSVSAFGSCCLSWYLK